MSARTRDACRTAAFVLCLLHGLVAFAQTPGSFDTTWRPDGRIVFGDPDTTVGSSAIAEVDGRIVIGGACSDAATIEGCAFVIGADGEPDAGYGGGVAPGGLVRSSVAGIAPATPTAPAGFFPAVDPQGRVAWFRTRGGLPGDIGRLDAADLAPDPAPGSVDLLAGDPGTQGVNTIRGHEGRIYVAGSARAQGGNQDAVLARLDAALGLDATFNGTGIRRVAFDGAQATNDFAIDVAIGPDGRAYAVVLVLPTAGGAPSLWVMAFESDGRLATDFGVAGRTQVPVAGAEFMQIAVDPQGRPVLAGSFLATPNTQDYDVFVARLTPGGVFDPDFGFAGVRRIAVDRVPGGRDVALAVAVQPDGRPVICGRAQSSDVGNDLLVARLDEVGEPDVEFGTDGLVVDSFGAGADAGYFDECSALGFDPDGRLLLAGRHIREPGSRQAAGVARLITGLPENRVFDDGFE